jgi:hypothetical protein
MMVLDRISQIKLITVNNYLSAMSQRISNLESRAAGRFTLSEILYTEGNANQHKPSKPASQKTWLQIRI